MKIGIEIAQKQNLSITQQVVQNLEILQMDAQELQAYLQRQAMDNPAIDLERLQDGGFGEQMQWLRKNERPQYERFSGEAPAFEAYAEPVSRGETLQENIQTQLSGCRLNEMEQLIANYLLGCIDSRGYLDENPEETAELLHVQGGDVERVLKLLRSFSPAGICARDLKHCLMAQLDSTGEDTLARQIVENHMADIAQSHYAQVARALNTDVKTVRRLIKRIRSLSPIPASGFDTGNRTYYIEPDVQILPRGEEMEISLPHSLLPHLCLSRTYLTLFEQTEDPQVRDYLGQKFKSARWLITCVEQRESTLSRCTAEIAALQKEYFLGQRNCPLPMTMGDIAERMDVHLSTVSRTVKGKYVQSIHGVLPMKSLFSAKLDKSTVHSAEEIRDKLRALIEGEKPSRPFSDQQLVDKLKEEGVSVSRRTIAKYRDELGIPGMFARKKEE